MSASKQPVDVLELTPTGWEGLTVEMEIGAEHWHRRTKPSAMPIGRNTE
jgi:hypothetical protein